MLAQATIPSFLRYGAYPYIVVVREHAGGDEADAIEHRFVGLFTVAAMNANVLDIPLISRRVSEALAMAQRDPSHPGQLLLDIIQTIPRSELFALSARRCLTWRWPWSTWDRGGARCCSCAPTSSRTSSPAWSICPATATPRRCVCEMQDILVRELGGDSIDYTARVSESPWAVVHFTVRLPEEVAPAGSSTSRETNQARIQDLLTEAARTWGDRLIGAVDGRLDRPRRRRALRRRRSPRPTSRPSRPTDAIDDIAIIEELQRQFGQAGVLRERRAREVAQLTWYLGGRSASLSQLLPMLQSMGVVVLEERPFTVTRPDGLQVWIYQFKISPHRRHPRGADGGRSGTRPRSGSPTRSPRSGTAAPRSTGSTNWCCAPA